MSEITQQQYINMKKKLYKDVKKETEIAFKKSEIKNKASALNLALPQYVRYFVIAKLVDIKDPLSLDFDQLRNNIRNKILIGGFLIKTYVSVALTIIDEVQYYLLKEIVAKTIPSTLTIQVVKMIKIFSQKIGLVVDEETVFEAFYLSHITNVRNLKVYNYNKNSFYKLTPKQQLEHVNQVIGHGLAMAYSYEASSIVAEYISCSKVLSNIRNIILIMKYVRYIKKSQEFNKVNEIQGSKFLSLITTKIKDAIMKFFALIKFGKLRYIIRFVLETILGPLVLASVINMTKPKTNIK